MDLIEHLHLTELKTKDQDGSFGVTIVTIVTIVTQSSGPESEDGDCGPVGHG